MRLMQTPSATPSSSGSSDGSGSSASHTWLLLNPGRYGMYRTNYSYDMWRDLTEAAADPRVIPPVDVAGRDKGNGQVLSFLLWFHSLDPLHTKMTG